MNDQAIIEALEPHTTPARRQRMRSVLETRSDYAAFVFEAMLDPHNFSAALRSLEAFSFQNIHLLQGGERLGIAPDPALWRNPAHDGKPNYPLYPNGPKAPSRGVSTGVDRWLSIQKHQDEMALCRQLRAEDRRIYVSCHSSYAVPLTQIPLKSPLALVFGNEHRGVSEKLSTMADAHFWIPTLGFVESLNLSVSVAVSAFYLRNQIDSLSTQGTQAATPTLPLNTQKKAALYAHWLKQSVKRSAGILKKPL